MHARSAIALTSFAVQRLDIAVLTGPTISSLATVLVSSNANLSAIDFPTLDAVGTLRVTGNGSLPQADAEAFADSLTFLGNRKVAGNAGFVPVDPCPFENDRECDETNGVCVTDANGCSFQ